MPTHILVIDDELSLQMLMKQRFRHKIQSGDYLFQFATSGKEALERLQSEPDVDVLLLDINMPDMDGLTLLNHLPELVPNSRTVMVSAYGDMANIRMAMNRGAFDFVMKPIDFKDLELTIEKTSRHVRQLRESVRVKAVADLKARFFDNITHEFRTPLSLIIAPVDSLLQRPNTDEFAQHHLQTVRRNAGQLLNLINQLLDLTRLEADSLPILEERVNVVAFLEGLVDLFVVGAEQKGLALRFSSNTAQQDALFDTDKWQKIIANLLSNALKFTPTGGCVTVAAQVSARQMYLTIADTGIGIPADQLPHIFDRFYQRSADTVDSTFTRVYEGSGIGLALAHELTRLLNGQLTVSSTPNVGTTFALTLPLNVPGPNDPVKKLLPRGVLSLPSAVTLPPQEPATSSDHPLILLVEDNPELLAFLVQSLANHYRVLTATNGREGLALALHELPDVVVSDVMMPEMDGYQLTHALKTNPATDHIAVILLSARSATQSRREGLAEGADDYLTKPFDLVELQFRLHNLISRQQKLRSYCQNQLNQVTRDPSSLLPQSSPDTSLQVGFLTQLNGLIENHLDDSEFRAEILADEAAMSIRTLTRKLNTLLGISPARLIRTYRLRRAVDLLRSGHPVSETAYMVGFEHPANFATAFKELYQQSPTDFILTHN